MGRLQKILLASLLMSAPLFFNVMAAESDSMSADLDPMKNKNMDAVDSRMLRITSPVMGYQPLSVADQKIDAAYLEETLGERHGAIILIHDQGEQFESQGVVTPLRHKLLQYGWSTLTLALDFPIEVNILLPSADESKDDEFEESTSSDTATLEKSNEDPDPVMMTKVSNQQRIEAAIMFLQEQGIDRFIFVGHGIGGNLATELIEIVNSPISALILVDTPKLSATDTFKALKLPILDVYGGQGLAGVENAVKQRKLMMKRSENEQYLMRKIDGADHVFYGLEEILVRTIRGWLKTVFLTSKEK